MLWTFLWKKDLSASEIGIPQHLPPVPKYLHPVYTELFAGSLPYG